MCGACDCPSCGPAQGYEVVRVWDSRLGRYVHRNPDGEDDDGSDDMDDDTEVEREHC
jgi:hypothetical protein